MSIARVRGPGHPDVACDLVAASIVEEYLKRDQAAKLSIRVAGGRGALFVTGDVLSSADFDVAALVRRVLVANGVQANQEPFIALEPMTPSWAPQFGSRDVCSVIGYATSEMSDRFPKAMSTARTIAQTLEEKRTSDPEWFWLGSDFEVVVDGDSVTIRVEQIGEALASLREKINALIVSHFTPQTLRINLAGEETAAGLGSRIGSSGSSSSIDGYGSFLPCGASGCGRHFLYPLNIGSVLARQVARELVEQQRGKAVLVQATWLPLESKPHAIRIRNERGEDLSSAVDGERFNLACPAAALLDPSLVSALARAPFDRTVDALWEKS